MKRDVRIRLTTVIDGSADSIEADGEAYVKDGQVYIRYAETGAGLQGVTTTVKIGKNDEIVVLRHGGVRSEQRFSAGKRTAGSYSTREGTFRLETLTKRIDTEFNDGIGTAVWSYQLWVGGAMAGHFQVSMDVREGAAQ